jgi:hypothetical protein
MSKIAIIRELLQKNPAMKIDTLIKRSGVERPAIHVMVSTARKELGLKSRQTLVRERKAKRKVNKTVPIVMKEPTLNDLVNHPPHYKAGGIETIDFIEAKKLNYNLGNVVKYVARADYKGARKQDLEKAVWYLQREISTL